LLMIMALFFGYFTFSEYLTKWYGNETGHSRVINALLDRYFLAFIIAHYLPVLVPAAVIGIKRFRTRTNITISAIIVMVAMFIHRYLIVVPTLENPFIPIQDSRPEWVHYQATWVEWAQVIGGFALVALLITIAHKWVPAIDIGEYQEVEKEEKEAKEKLDSKLPQNA
jgi:Ni/Fe-hydrogenase subunit HybB-like protein